jgi:hypothetical protein
METKWFLLMFLFHCLILRKGEFNANIKVNIILFIRNKNDEHEHFDVFKNKCSKPSRLVLFYLEPTQRVIAD